MSQYEKSFQRSTGYHPIRIATYSRLDFPVQFTVHPALLFNKRTAPPFPVLPRVPFPTIFKVPVVAVRFEGL